MDKLKKFPDYEVITIILEELNKFYGHRICIREIFNKCTPPQQSNLLRHLIYLDEHELIKIHYYNAPGHQKNSLFNDISLTAKGVDFLMPDGGLSALSAPFIRIAPDNIRNIIEKALQERQDISQEEKTKLQKALSIAEDQTLRDLVTTIITKGVASLPKIGEIISTILHS